MDGERSDDGLVTDGDECRAGQPDQGTHDEQQKKHGHGSTGGEHDGAVGQGADETAGFPDEGHRSAGRTPVHEGGRRLPVGGGEYSCDDRESHAGQRQTEDQERSDRGGVLSGDEHQGKDRRGEHGDATDRAHGAYCRPRRVQDGPARSEVIHHSTVTGAGARDSRGSHTVDSRLDPTDLRCGDW